jgi:antitoxin component of RelBE/YafQ-DinJ toxin-antitoxin module
MPDQVPTDEQKKVIAELMGLTVSDVIKVRVTLCD